MKHVKIRGLLAVVLAAVVALLSAVPASASTDTSFGKGNCTARLQGYPDSDQNGSWMQLTVSSGCNDKANGLQQIQTELLYYGIRGDNSRVEFVGPSTGNYLIAGAPRAHSMVAQAGAPATGFSQYCASGKVYYAGLTGAPDGNGAVLTQYSGVVCWS
ncbi:hypothetical protein FPZ12_018860 [Amycolatopsis acidicola]|uniref:Secreted protein n=1 Tax=Amycolatopsis acidicola TaxID=2596893 RepID=A0A5N0V295_9PSEU|nr:hypothetical protein [Amycolatopsis acidicola]KAA9159954.1 hypothetical protein FPZ12_018860 [Amycolatopsis acidicola]